MVSWNGFFSDDELKELRDLLLEAGYGTPVKLDYLLGALPVRYRAGLGGDALPILEQWLTKLRQMNMSYSLKGGERPLLDVISQVLADTSDAQLSARLEPYKQRVDNQPEPLVGASPRALTADARAADSANPSFAAVANTAVTEEVHTNALDETVSVKFLRKGAETASSVFKIIVKRFFAGEQDFANGRPALEMGTGWVIAPGLAITNHHVIDARMIARGEASADLPDLEKQAATAEILFDYYAADENATGIEFGDNALQAFSPRIELDYALLRLPATAPPRNPLLLATRKLSKRPEQGLGARVNVIQHPNGKPMRVGFRNNYVIVGDDNILAYLTDTASGSSGSPVLDDTWRTVALHRGARGISIQNIMLLHTLIKQENIGTQISRIMTDLSTRYPALHAEILDGQQALTA